MRRISMYKNKDKLKDKDIRKLRMDMGRFLHSYYVKFGEEKYQDFLKKIAPSFVEEYGEPFSESNLRIMEAEYVTFNSKIGEKNKPQNRNKHQESFIIK